MMFQRYPRTNTHIVPRLSSTHHNEGLNASEPSKEGLEISSFFHSETKTLKQGKALL
jgi:hypothetical protein